MPYGAYPTAYDPLRAAKRAGTLLMVLGCVGLLCGAAGAFMAKNWDLLMSQQPAEMRASMPPEANAAAVMHGSLIALGVAFIMVILGVLVRRGAKGPTVISTVLVGILIVYPFGLSILGALVLAGRGMPQGAISACMFTIVVGVLIWELIWLIGALRGSSAAQQLQAAYQAQYWQYVQQQQAYHAGAGYSPPGTAAPGAYNPYNAPPAGPTQSGAGQTGWQWSAPPPPPPPPPPTGQNPGGPYGQGPGQ
jgi:hypothetical protein